MLCVSVTPWLVRVSRISLDARAEAAQDLVRDRADPRRHLARVDRLLRLAALRSEEHDFVARPTPSMSVTSTVSMSMLTAPTIVRAAAADQHEAAVLEPAIEAISVTGGNDSQGHGAIGGESAAVADALARRARLSPRRPGWSATSPASADRRCQRRRHQAVEQQARAARSRTRRASRAAARRSSRRDAGAGRRRARRASRHAASNRVRCVSNSLWPGSSAVPKCVCTASSARFALASSSGSVRRRLSWRKPRRFMPVSILR